MRNTCSVRVVVWEDVFSPSRYFYICRRAHHCLLSSLCTSYHSPAHLYSLSLSLIRRPRFSLCALTLRRLFTCQITRATTATNRTKFSCFISTFFCESALQVSRSTIKIGMRLYAIQEKICMVNNECIIAMLHLISVSNYYLLVGVGGV